MHMMKSILGLLAAAVCLDVHGQAATSSVPKGPVEAELREDLKGAMNNPRDNPNLPRVLLIGDSISIGYTVPVRLCLRDKANVHRPPVNCQYTGFGLQNLPKWLGTGKWDVIHFNWGIWDTHYLDKKTGALVRDESKTDPTQVRIRYTPEEYAKNLEKLVSLLEGTGARLIWASSTPILSRTGDRFKDIERYNAAAAAVMKAHGVPIDDLYTFVLPRTAQWQSADRVHFNATGNKALGEKVAQSIQEALAKPKVQKSGQP